MITPQLDQESVFMGKNANLNAIYAPSEDVVARKIEDELIIVPLTAGIGDMEDELFTLNETGVSIWERLDGIKSLKDVVNEISQEFDAPVEEIVKDVIGFVEELLKRGMLVEVSS
jgi:hypothetical protein